jgi:hypothetical protein
MRALIYLILAFALAMAVGEELAPNYSAHEMAR